MERVESQWNFQIKRHCGKEGNQVIEKKNYQMNNVIRHYKLDYIKQYYISKICRVAVTIFI